MRNAVSMLLLGGLLILSSCSKKVDEPPPSTFKPVEAPPLPPGPEKLEIVDETVGTGPESKKGDKIKVHYTGKLLNGKQFDSSVGKAPFEVTIGAGMVIKGWDEGLVGMKAGGKRKLTIPWHMAYGDKGQGATIPPKAALMFDIELLEIEAEGDAGKDAGKAAAAPAPKGPAAPAPAAPPAKK